METQKEKITSRLQKATDELRFALLKKNDAEKRELTKHTIDSLNEEVHNAENVQMDILMEIADLMEDGTLTEE